MKHAEDILFLSRLTIGQDAYVWAFQKTAAFTAS